LPVGAAAGHLLRSLIQLLDLDPVRSEAFLVKEERRLNAYLAGLADTYYRAGFQREYSLVGESAQVAGLSDFLAGTLGLLPRTLVITDNPPDYVREALVSQLAGLVPGFPTEVAFIEDRGEIADLVLAANPGLVLGSSLEAVVADRLGVPFLQVSFPVADRVLLSRAYAGYRGAATLLEDLGSAILSHAHAEAT
jgi:nitrogenase molybdenum-iron protein beta chain